jgi:DNA repair protein RadC
MVFHETKKLSNRGHVMKESSALLQLVGSRHWGKLPTTLTDLCKMTTDDIVARGIPKTDASKISAAIILAREIAEPSQDYGRTQIKVPADAIRYALSRFVALSNHGVQEEFWVVTLDTKNRVINDHKVTVGTLRNSLVHPREVFRPAIADAANCIVCVHNHPSGDPTPSDQDMNVTERLEKAAEIIGIPVIDHIVVAGGNAVSIVEARSANRW